MNDSPLPTTRTRAVPDSQPWLHQRGIEIQAFGTVRHFPLGLARDVLRRQEIDQDRFRVRRTKCLAGGREHEPQHDHCVNDDRYHETSAHASL